VKKLSCIVFIIIYSIISGCGSNPTINEYIIDGRTNESLKYIKSGGDINVSNNQGLTPLHVAAKKGNLIVLKALLERGANVNKKAGSLTMTPIQLASFNDNAAITLFLIEKGAHIDTNDNQGRTALKIASKLGNNNVVKALLKGGAKINKMQNLSSTALIEAVSGQQLETVNLLILSGANINATDEKGNTPLIIAAYKGNQKILTTLLDNGADVSLANNENQTALIVGAFIENKLIVNSLINKNANIHTKTKYGRSALHLVAIHNNQGLMTILLNQGAQPLIIELSEDDYFGTALSHGAYAEYLINKGQTNESKQYLRTAIKYFKKSEDQYQQIKKDLDSKITSQNIKTIIMIAFVAYGTQVQANINARASGTGHGYAYNQVNIKGTGTLSESRDSFENKGITSTRLKNKYTSIHNCVLSGNNNKKCINKNKGL